MKYNIKVEKTTNSRLSSINFKEIPFGKTFSDHMFIADYKDGKWVDFQIMPYGPISFNPSMLALHYGQSIFEGMKATKMNNGDAYLFRPEQHAIRLNKSAARLCMPAFPEDLFVEALHQLVDLDQGWIPADEGSALYIRPFMFATEEKLGVKVSDTYRFIIITGPVGPYYPKPVKLIVAQKYIRAVAGGVGEAKAAGNYAASLLPAAKAIEMGYDQVMWMDGKEFKYVQEIGTMNIFFVIGDTVVTPATDGAILKGITRACFIQLLKDKGIKVEERKVSIDELVEAYDNGTLKEAFGSGTAAVVANVSHIKYQDKIMELPPIETHKNALYLKQTLNQIRNGSIEDPHNWMVKINEKILA